MDLIQTLLRARDHAFAVDGRFGLRTEAALLRFPAGQGLAASGVAGPLTWAALER